VDRGIAWVWQDLVNASPRHNVTAQEQSDQVSPFSKDLIHLSPLLFGEKPWHGSLSGRMNNAFLLL
jgi:hypothetical protein